MDESIKVLPIDVIVSLMEESFEKGLPYKLVITGNSMTPTLREGRDMVVLQKLGNHKIKKYDLVFARRISGEYILHRVVKINPDGNFILNGDAQEWSELMLKENVIAYCNMFIRKGKVIRSDSFSNQVYVRLWALTRPFRRTLIQLKNKLVK